MKKRDDAIPLTFEENQSYHKQKVRYISKNNLVLMMTKKIIIKSEITVIILENMEALLITFVI